MNHKPETAAMEFFSERNFRCRVTLERPSQAIGSQTGGRRGAMHWGESVLRTIHDLSNLTIYTPISSSKSIVLDVDTVLVEPAVFPV